MPNISNVFYNPNDIVSSHQTFNFFQNYSYQWIVYCFQKSSANSESSRNAVADKRLLWQYGAVIYKTSEDVGEIKLC